MTPDYDAFGASVSPIHYVLNDENGEDFVGRMKTSGAYTVAALMWRSKLFNYFERLRSHNRRKRHKSTGGCMIKEQWYLTCKSHGSEGIAAGRRAQHIQVEAGEGITAAQLVVEPSGWQRYRPSNQQRPNFDAPAALESIQNSQSAISMYDSHSIQPRRRGGITR